MSIVRVPLLLIYGHIRYQAPMIALIKRPIQLRRRIRGSAVRGTARSLTSTPDYSVAQVVANALFGDYLATY
jgi:hypothetical protein